MEKKIDLLVHKGLSLFYADKLRKSYTSNTKEFLPVVPFKICPLLRQLQWLKKPLKVIYGWYNDNDELLVGLQSGTFVSNTQKEPYWFLPNLEGMCLEEVLSCLLFGVDINGQKIIVEKSYLMIDKTGYKDIKPLINIEKSEIKLIYCPNKKGSKDAI